MDFLQVKGKTKVMFSVLLVFLLVGACVNAENTAYYAGEPTLDLKRSDIVTLDRQKRDAPAPAPANVPPPASPAPPAANATLSNATTNQTSASATTAPATVRVPMLGANGTGVRWENATKSVNEPKVSDPLTDGTDDNITEIFKETPEQIQQVLAQHNLTDLQYENHSFYSSTFIGNRTYFDEYWANLTAARAEVHPILSDSHRRATALKLQFPFPFYGHPLHNITVATGGFIYTGEHVHHWLAATQYIAPLMANFDTTQSDDSVVKVSSLDDQFTAIWENVALQEDKSHKFTFAVTLYKNGDIIFAYKDIPIPIGDINEYVHPVKVGISDAYQTDRIVFYVRRKTIYEYHRVNFRDYQITNHTMLRLVALPTCLQYNSCAECVNHDTGFNCTWCEQIQRCSSGTDRNKQDWVLRHCDQKPVMDVSQCKARNASVDQSVPYGPDSTTSVVTTASPLSPPSPVRSGAAAPYQSSVGGAVAAFVIVALLATLAGWTVYAFKNPHTRSGQMLIKYRPSQWSWKRGEARYTAATIHIESERECEETPHPEFLLMTGTAYHPNF
ncbi:plexin domain-containing protein 2 isoform X2 [Plutella xylostella]|uniref:plexin domain-containing protein 2 isoform X2 n=1 Tax=Plutella xylostella TaxID=51655 RepID=UPI002032BAE4|nr:plexin domain-containing protein 2 isoform X2 [Plutella xylostella]